MSRLILRMADFLQQVQGYASCALFQLILQVSESVSLP